MDKSWDEVNKEEILSKAMEKVEKLRNNLKVAELELYELIDRFKKEESGIK